MPSRARREARIAKGMCPQCGVRKPKAGSKHCVECIEYERTRSLGRTKKSRENGTCRWCGKIKDSDKSILCVNCDEKNQEYKRIGRSWV